MINIRKAKIEDIDNLIILWIKLMEYHKEKKIYFLLSADWKEQKRNELEWIVKSDLTVVYIVEEGNKLIGYIRGTIHKLPLLYDIKYEGSIEEIFILPEYRRKGYATKLFQSLVKDFNKRELEYININVDIENETGEKFWDALGFNTISLKKRYNL
ncbi:MAG: GNAT family N-acetyltransferase [Epulopiscium sp.]|nr:GNAT family N-acetyltransferase [Candidatus Epulonipiscium sp.]